MTLAIQGPITRDPGPMTLAIRWPHDPGENVGRWPHVPGDRHLLRAAPRRAGADFKEVWRHHGPKISPQIRFLTDQLEARGRARGVPTDAISALAARALPR